MRAFGRSEISPRRALAAAPRFEVDWGSPDALSNLTATGETRREEVAERHPVGSNEAQR